MSAMSVTVVYSVLGTSCCIYLHLCFSNVSDLVCLYQLQVEPPTLFSSWLTDRLVVAGLPVNLDHDSAMLTAYVSDSLHLLS